MRDVRLYHKASADSADQILADGLRYGVEGSNGRDDETRRANEFLNGCCTDELRRRGVDRRKCTYCYLGVEGWVLEVETGAAVERRRWDVGEDVALELRVDADSVFVSDLDAYDRVARALADGAAEPEVDELGREYWRRMVRLSDLCRHYRLDGDTLVAAADAPAGLPARLERVELLLTRDVPPGSLRRVDLER